MATSRRYTSRSKKDRPHANGHKFGPELICLKVGCGVSWSDHQEEPLACAGQSGSPHLSPLGKRVSDAKLPYWKIGKGAGYTSTTVGRVLTPEQWPGLLPITIERVTDEAETLLVLYGKATRGEFASTPLLLQSGL